MANNAKLVVADLDFDGIKANLRGFLRSQSQFKDYDFEGSSMSILIDLLAYNTHMNAYYANMIASEMFLDTAVFRESIVSRAKMLGYTPKSRTSASAYINLTTYIRAVPDQVHPPTITLERYSLFSSSIGNTEYSFTTPDNNTLQYNSSLSNADQWVYNLDCIKIIEGKHIYYEYVVSDVDVWNTGMQNTQHFIIPAPNIDVNSLVVSVKTSANDSSTTLFRAAGELQTITSADAVYWLHEVEGNKYEITFGDDQNVGVGVVGGNIIQLDYLVTNGSDANGCKKFFSRKRLYGGAGWTGTLASPIEITYSLDTTSYRVLDIIQDYTFDFMLGETVTGKLGSATGIVSEWDDKNGTLKLISTIGVFSVNETVVGAKSFASGIIKLSSLEISRSVDGSDRETNTSIRDLAPKVFQTQNRCVTIDDYVTTIKRDYPGARAVRVWGGESMTPPVYGKVFISIRPHTGTYLTNYEKNYVSTTILGKRNMVTVSTEVVDPDYIFVIPDCRVKYNPSLIIGVDSIINNVVGVINNYSIIHLDDFASPLYFTKLSSDIDDSDRAISSNILSLRLKKRFEPTLNISTTQELLFSNKLRSSDTEYPYGTITSSMFTFGNTTTGTPVSGCEFRVSDADNRVLQVIKIYNGVKTVICGGENVGFVDYENGIVTITDFMTTYTNEINDYYPELKGLIYIIALPFENDVFTKENQILNILPSDISVSKIDVRTLI